MNLKKKELIITIIMIVVFLVVGFNASTLASSNNGTAENKASLTWPTGNNTATNNDTIERVNTTNETANNVAPNTTNNTTNNTANNTPGNLANTGLEDAPWLIIGICAVSAIFAYNKIKEYKSF